MEKNLFDIEVQWHLYCERMNLPESRMHPDQKRETKRAFVGAWGQLLMLMKHEAAALPEEQAIRKLEGMENQVLQFWKDEVIKQHG